MIRYIIFTTILLFCLVSILFRSNCVVVELDGSHIQQIFSDPEENIAVKVHV